MSKTITTSGRRFTVIAALVSLSIAIMFLGTTTGRMAGGNIGSFITVAVCDGLHLNHFDNKNAVYIEGKNYDAGSYTVSVYGPGDPTPLGTSVPGALFINNNGDNFCLQLTSLVTFADTGNNGDVYKVEITRDADGAKKSDNFKIDGGGATVDTTLSVTKFYDANANGINDAGDIPITGWSFTIEEGSFTDSDVTPASLLLNPGTFIVKEGSSITGNWQATTPTSVEITLNEGDSKSVDFGNLCLGGDRGHTLGFWSNKNGQTTMGGNAGAAYLGGLSSTTPGPKFFRNAGGGLQTFGSYSVFRTWILSATASNMAYMLSAQLAAMELNVQYFGQSGSALVYAPGATSANSLGYATIQNLMDEAENSLAVNGNTVASGATRTYQEALKNALDKANNNLNFVQAGPCAFSFAP